MPGFFGDEMGGQVDAISFVRISSGIHIFFIRTARMSYYRIVISLKNGYDFNVCNNVRDVLYYTDVINSVVKLIAHSPVLWVS